MHPIQWRAAFELLKPITWFAPMWAFACGAVSSGASPDGRWLVIIAGIVLAGPLVCATSQAVNDWFDRHVDAVNEPQRPIPSGRLPVAAVYTLLLHGLFYRLRSRHFLAPGASEPPQLA